MTVRQRWSESSRGEKLLLAAGAVGVLHNVDHVLRFDHSGWPFIPEVSPLTFSWLLFPLVAYLVLARSRPILRVSITALMFVGVQTAHILIETPADQYGVWARGFSVEPYAFGQPNLLGVASPAVGFVAAALSVAASLLLLAALLSFLQEARRARPIRISPAAASPRR